MESAFRDRLDHLLSYFIIIFINFNPFKSSEGLSVSQSVFLAVSLSLCTASSLCTVSLPSLAARHPRRGPSRFWNPGAWDSGIWIAIVVSRIPWLWNVSRVKNAKEEFNTPGKGSFNNKCTQGVLKSAHLYQEARAQK